MAETTSAIASLFALGLLLVGLVQAGRALRRRVLPRDEGRREVEQLLTRIRGTWPGVCLNLRLTMTDEMTRSAGVFRRAGNPSQYYPAIEAAWTDEHGVTLLVAPLLGVGLEQFVKAAPHLANEWGCSRVEADQPVPGGAIRLRGLVTDPLELRLQADADEWWIGLGQDGQGAARQLLLRNLSGLKVAGIPGFGKTVALHGMAAQLMRSEAVQLVVLDGKVSDVRYGDWGEIAPRCWLASGDDPEQARDTLAKVVDLIRARPEQLRAARGTHRMWEHGPTPEHPLVVVVIDEAHVFCDTGGLAKAEKQVIEECSRLMRSIVKEGRGVGVLPILATQRQSSDSIPTVIRDQLEVGLCFAVSTIDAAVMALGPGIREAPHLVPTRWLDKSRYVGVCTAVGLPGEPGFCALRVPNIAPSEIAEAVSQTAHLRRELSVAPTSTADDDDDGLALVA